MSDFSALLGAYLGQLGELRRRGASEASIRDAFLQFLRSAFPRVNEAEPFWLEKHVPALRVRGGFVDALFGDLIFEFKRRLDETHRAEGVKQLQEYLAGQDTPERFFGILTDGEMLEVYALREGEILPRDQLVLRPEEADRCKLWLDCYLFHEKHVVPTANDVALRFGERSPTFWRSMELLGRAWREAQADPAVRTKFAEWNSLLSFVYGSPVGDENVFLRHTYLALFARVLAFVALERRAPHRDEVEGVVMGAVFERRALDNFITDDFFTWVTHSESILRDLIASLGTRLIATYELERVREDLLKELYQELVDPETRHDLGEFYTPDWLAELTLKEAGFPRVDEKSGWPVEQSLLDPACGSGTFLFVAVRLLRHAGLKGENLVSFCERQLAGMDVHPLAVTIARTNLVLAVGEDLRGLSRRFHVPIYMANTLSVPDRGQLQPAVSVPVDVEGLAKQTGKKPENCLPREFQLPQSLATDVSRLSQAIDILADFAKPERADAEARAGCAAELAQLGVPQNEMHYWHSDLRLMRWLLKAPATNSVWRFILKNAYAPLLLATRRFDFVVGNPPWLSYRFIQRRDYQEQVRYLAVERFRLLDKADAHLVTQIELATIFFAFCAEIYLADFGTLAFVLPRSILTGAKQHRGFRQKYINGARSLIDCEQVRPLFNVPSCVVIWDRTTQPPDRGAIPILRLGGELPGRNVSWDEARSVLKEIQETFSLPRELGQSPYYDHVFQGASLVPRALWFVRTLPDARVDRQMPYLETDPSVDAQAKPPWKGLRVEGKVESDFLFATLLSDNMVPFGARRLSLVVLPLLPQKGGRVRIIEPLEALRLGHIYLCDWVENAAKLWDARRKSQFSLVSRLNWQGKLTSQRVTGVFKVLYCTSGTHLCSCVIDPHAIAKAIIHRLPVRGFVADTKTYWFETKRAGEAYYLSAVLNAPCVDEAIKPFQTKGAFGAHRGKGQRDIHRRPFEVLPIPLFDSSRAAHQELARLGRRCHTKVGKIVASLSEADLAQPIGKLRQRIREEIAEELSEIDQLVRKILKLSN
ncbi:MAG: SAM-dependent methyltransferase [Thermoguttaceae bacterium]|nr:SAM-dependent methyltransferase [Thermoguttaceae bacterium]MDW8077885.1 N-6 DNA methylase [Thermoguttaceae bacterium]